MLRTEYFGLKRNHVSNAQWDSYCRTEGILHKNIDLIDSTMIVKRSRRK